jgi:hypothetical protein
LAMLYLPALTWRYWLCPLLPEQMMNDCQRPSPPFIPHSPYKVLHARSNGTEDHGSTCAMVWKTGPSTCPLTSYIMRWPQQDTKLAAVKTDPTSGGKEGTETGNDSDGSNKAVNHRLSDVNWNNKQAFVR